MKFMSFSLGELVGNLGKENMVQMKKFFGEKLDLLSRKGVYPYEFMDSFEKFRESLPGKDAFFFRLNGDWISDEDFEHANKVWKEFGLSNMGDFLYLKTDVLLLMDVFEEFRKVCLLNYELDPCWYLTASSLAWDAMLKLTGVKLELLSDPEMHLFFERQIRGGFSTAFYRLGRANNKFMKNFDKTKPSKFLTYLDANSLYATAMCEPLPVDEFAWMEEDDLKKMGRI